MTPQDLVRFVFKRRPRLASAHQERGDLNRDVKYNRDRKPCPVCGACYDEEGRFEECVGPVPRDIAQLEAEILRLRDIVIRANNILFDAGRHVDDVEHTIECHADTVNDHFRAVAKDVKAAMDVVGAEVLDMVGG